MVWRTKNSNHSYFFTFAFIKHGVKILIIVLFFLRSQMFWYVYFQIFPIPHFYDSQLFWYSSTFDDFFVSIHIKLIFWEVLSPQPFNKGGSETMVLQISNLVVPKCMQWNFVNRYSYCHMFWCHWIFLCAVGYTRKQHRGYAKMIKFPTKIVILTIKLFLHFCIKELVDLSKFGRYQSKLWSCRSAVLRNDLGHKSCLLVSSGGRLEPDQNPPNL